VPTHGKYLFFLKRKELHGGAADDGEGEVPVGDGENDQGVIDALIGDVYFKMKDPIFHNFMEYLG
jgi:hypothetical protein